MKKYESFKVGTNVFVIRDNNILLGKRKNVYGAGEWGLPGGHLEMNESMLESAARELLEETGLVAKKLTFTNMVNGHNREDHRIQVGFVASGTAGEPELKEPEYCEEWCWFPLDNLPKNIFSGHVTQIQLYIDGQKPFSDE